MTQGSTIYSTYLSDQLREDMKRDDLVNEGKLSRSEAEQQAEEWEQVSGHFCFICFALFLIDVRGIYWMGCWTISFHFAMMVGNLFTIAEV